MKILLLCDDYYHHSDTVIRGLEFLKENHDVDIIENTNDFKSDLLKNYHLIIFSKSNNYSRNERENWLNAEIEEAFQNYVIHGGSLIVIHSGTAGYRENLIFRHLIGGVFNHHPEQCEIVIEPTRVHEITNGVHAFTIFDEHYHMDLYDNSIEVLFNTISKHGTQPGGWIKTLGKGKVFVFTPGHNLDVWLNDHFKQIIVNVIKHCEK